MLLQYSHRLEIIVLQLLPNPHALIATASSQQRRRRRKPQTLDLRIVPVQHDRKPPLLVLTVTLILLASTVPARQPAREVHFPRRLGFAASAFLPSPPDPRAGVEAACCEHALADAVGFPGAGADRALVAARDGRLLGEVCEGVDPHCFVGAGCGDDGEVRVRLA